MTETLDERLERLYGPQKRKWNTPVASEIYQVSLPRMMPQTTGQEMAERLLGHSIEKEWYYENS